MISFFVMNGHGMRSCTATDTSKAAEILKLMFPAKKGYVIDNNRVVFAQNMTIEEAEVVAGIRSEKPLSITLLPVKAKKAKAKKKPVKAKKTKLKSKVVLKNKKPTVKKTLVKSKVKPKTKKTVKAKAKGKKR